MRRFSSVILITLILLMFMSIRNLQPVYAEGVDYDGLIALGQNHTIALTKTGEIFAWGRNNYFQLGDGTDVSSSTPINITSRFNLNIGEVIIDVEAGGFHSAAITSEGRIFTWGANEDAGQLGDDTYINSDTPIDITTNFDLNLGEKIIEVDLGLYFSAAITSEGRVFTWGDNGNGQLGNNTITLSKIPIEITSNFELSLGETIVDVDLGYSHALAISSEHKVFSFGGNDYGQLGEGTTTNRFTPTDITSYFILNLGEVLSGVEAGYRHSIAFTSEGRVFTWGENSSFQLGDGTDVNKSIPTDITSGFNLADGEKIISANASSDYSGAVSSGGRVFMWGSNEYDKLATGDYSNDTPTDITDKFVLAYGEIVTFIDLGFACSSVITSTGDLYLWGDNSRGQIGDGTFEGKDSPTLISLNLAAPDTTAPTFDTIFDRTIEAGIYTDIDWSTYIVNAIDESGGILEKIEVEDNVLYDTLGIYTVTVKVVDESDNEEEKTFNVTVVDTTAPVITLNGDSTVYVEFEGTYTEDGATFSDNYDASGSAIVGGDIVDSSTLGEYIVTYNITDSNGNIAVEVKRTVIVQNTTVLTLEAIDDQTIEAGDYTDIDWSFLAKDETIIKITTGYFHTAAITSKGRIFTWGWNDFGQLGDGTTTSRYTPTEITINFNLNAEETVIEIISGYYHTVAITSEGRVFTWGYNAYGQLGDGTTTSRYTPTEITSNFNLNAGETVIAITVGMFHTATITSEGRVFTWGSNGHGQLGDGTITNRNTPTEITSNFYLDAGETVMEITAGDYHTAAITSKGRVFTWGYNPNGQLGDETTTERYIPTEITSNFNLNAGEIVIEITAGYGHTAAITSEGRVFTWGNNIYGQLGDGTTTSRYTLTEITNNFNLNIGETVIELTAGMFHTATITSEGRIFTWGYNEYGQLGDGTTTNRYAPTEITSNFSFNAGETVIENTAGQYHTAAITSQGRIFTWGYNHNGQLGDGTINDKYTPTEITSNFTFDETLTKVEVEDNVDYDTPGIYTVTVKLVDESLNETSQTFNVIVEDTTAPTFSVEIGYLELGDPIAEELRQYIYDIYDNFDENPHVDINETYINHYILGEYIAIITVTDLAGNATIKTMVVHIIDTTAPTFDGIADQTIETGDYIDIDWSILAKDETIIQISAGYAHTAAITSEGRIFTWGFNRSGQLGDGTATDRYTPIEITSYFDLNAGETIIEISAGEHHTAAITSEGRVFTWGNNCNKQLGDGTTTDRYTPTEITSYFNLNAGETIIGIAAGIFNTAAITSEGRVFTWGYNGHGQLGDGTTISRDTPAEITSNFNLNTGETIIEITAGQYHTAAITSEGRIFTWGSNGYGQLGDGTIINRETPTEITSNFNLNESETVIEITAGNYHTAIITSEGRAFTWGRNENGQLGDGTSNTDAHPMPTEITSNFILNAEEIVLTITAEYYHTAAITSQGRVFTWGYNISGQLGDGTTTDRYTPTEITSNFNLNAGETVIAITAGRDHTAAITSQGRILTWGGNFYGPLGDGTTTTRYIPADITSNITLDEITYDNSDGYLTTIEAIDNVDYDTPGIYTVTVKLVDESLNETSQIFNVTVVDTTAPTFDTIEDQVIEKGLSNIDWTTVIINETDNSDGVLTKIEVEDNVDHNTLGTYTVTVKLVDESLNEISQTFNVTVQDTIPPQVQLNPSLDSIELGSNYNDYGVTAIDVTNTEVTIEGTVDTNTPGVYILTYLVIDTSGNETRIVRHVTVYEETVDVEFVLESANTTIFKGEEYTDGGCKVYLDGNEQDCIIKESNLDTNTQGIYTITYSYIYREKEYTFNRYVFVVDDGVPLTLYYLYKEEEGIEL